MKIGITGATGFIGSRLVALANECGHHVVGFSRQASRPIPGCMEVREFQIDREPNVEGCEAIIHLAGEPILGLWTARKRTRVLNSRKFGTRSLVSAIMRSSQPPKVLVSSSGIAFYGDTGDESANEDSPSGSGFLAEVTHVWEGEALRARENGVRVVLLRTSLVLGKGGGAMRMIGPVFRAGLGGEIGSGRQWMSWIHIEDQAALALFAAESDRVQGPLNAATPTPCRNNEFTRTLSDVVHRPAFFRVPAFAIKAVLGDFAPELLGNKRVIPKRVLEYGFRFQFPDLRVALKDVFGTEKQAAE